MVKELAHVVDELNAIYHEQKSGGKNPDFNKILSDLFGKHSEKLGFKELSMFKSEVMQAKNASKKNESDLDRVLSKFKTSEEKEFIASVIVKYEL